MDKKKWGGNRTGSGRKNENKKATFLSFRWTPEEAEELKKVFEEYKKRNNLTTTQALKKIILEKK